MAPSRDIGPPPHVLILTPKEQKGAILYLLVGPFLKDGVAGAKDAPPPYQFGERPQKFHVTFHA